MSDYPVIVMKKHGQWKSLTLMERNGMKKTM